LSKDLVCASSAAFLSGLGRNRLPVCLSKVSSPVSGKAVVYS